MLGCLATIIDPRGFLEVINLLLVILGGLLGLMVLQRLRGGKMASAVLLVLVAGGIFAVHELIDILFGWIWPQPWHDAAYSVTETIFILVFVIAIFRLERSIPGGP